MMFAFKPLARVAVQLSERLKRPRKATAAELNQIRRRMGEQVLDCELKTARRVRSQLEGARTAMQLWLLRSEIYQAVSDQFGQHEAMRRVKLLTPEFEGLLPERQLRSV